MIPRIDIQEHNTLVQIARRLAKSTCQLYLYRNDRFNVPKPHGCCVLFEFNGLFYCLSNAHVLGDEYMGQAFVLTSKNNLNGKGETTTIGGQYYFTKLPLSKKREDDIIDMAIVRLTSDCANDLIERGYIFIDLENIETNYIISVNDKLLINGYPGSSTKVNTHLKNVIAKPFYLLTVPYYGNLKKINFTSEFHIAAKYSMGKIFNPKSGNIDRGPSPYGISGSGLWRVTKDENGNQKALLIGILSTYLQNRSIVIGTRISLFIDLIKQIFDPTIPNKGVGVKLLN